MKCVICGNVRGVSTIKITRFGRTVHVPICKAEREALASGEITEGDVWLAFRQREIEKL